MAGHRENVIFLTADAFGVLPPISRLTPDQAQYHFISGYTAKLAGTEIGVTEPQATFSACFGAPFLPRHPGVYAAMLAERLERHDVPVWLVNTGWTGGPYGVGERMSIDHTRTMVRAALSGALEACATRPIRSSASRCRRGAGRAVGDAPAARHLAGHGGLRRQGARAGRACSPRTSRAMPTASRRQCAPPVRASRETSAAAPKGRRGRGATD